MTHKKTVFLSGSQGFIGRNFLEYSQNDYTIEAPARVELELTNSQAVDHYFSKKKFNTFIHGASIGIARQSFVDPLQGLNANLRAFSSLFKQQHAYDRFIHLGSGAEYGRPIAQYQIQEDDLGKHLPSDEYGFAKLLCSKCVMSETPDKAVTLNLFGVFGPYEDYQVRFISNAIVRTLFDLPIVIHQNVEFDYVYIKDLIRIIHFFMENTPSYSNYNVTMGQPVTLLEIAETIKNMMGSPHDIIVKQPGLAPAYTGSNHRLRQFLGANFQFTSLKKSIEELAQWYEKSLETLNKDKVINFI